MCSGFEEVSYLRLIDSCITQLKAQGPARTCNESNEEEGEDPQVDILKLTAILKLTCWVPQIRQLWGANEPGIKRANSLTLSLTLSLSLTHTHTLSLTHTLTHTLSHAREAREPSASPICRLVLPIRRLVRLGRDSSLQTRMSGCLFIGEPDIRDIRVLRHG